MAHHKRTTTVVEIGLSVSPRWRTDCSQALCSIFGFVPLPGYVPESNQSTSTGGFKMKKEYVKPSLMGLGLLRMVTKFSYRIY